MKKNHQITMVPSSVPSKPSIFPTETPPRFRPAEPEPHLRWPWPWRPWRPWRARQLLEAFEEPLVGDFSWDWTGKIDGNRIERLVGGLVAIFCIFPLILGCCHHPNWRTHIFQRGGPTTNQKGLNLNVPWQSRCFFSTTTFRIEV